VCVIIGSDKQGEHKRHGDLDPTLCKAGKKIIYAHRKKHDQNGNILQKNAHMQRVQSRKF
jgi:F420-0:gamma-glutamyl ligase